MMKMFTINPPPPPLKMLQRKELGQALQPNMHAHAHTHTGKDPHPKSGNDMQQWVHKNQNKTKKKING